MVKKTKSAVSTFQAVSSFHHGATPGRSRTVSKLSKFLKSQVTVHGSEQPEVFVIGPCLGVRILF